MKRIYRTLDQKLLPCSKCKEELPTSSFYIHRQNGIPRYMPRCKNCQRKANKNKAINIVFEFKHYSWTYSALVSIRSKYGLTNEQFFALVRNSDGNCPICCVPFKNTKNMHVDHCHTTGQVRGLLCGKCNRLLGHADDDILILQNAVQYLTRDNP